MVVILKKPKLIYIEEPRTASRSTHLWLTQHLDGIAPWPAQKNGLSPYLVRHTEPLAFRKLVREGKLSRVNFLKGNMNQYEFFAFVRNPFNTVVSYYVKARTGMLGLTRRKECALARKSKSFKQFLQLVLERLPGALSEEHHLARLDHIQHVLHFEDGYPGVLFRFLQGYGMRITQAQKKGFLHHGKTPCKRKDWRTYYDDEAKEIVAGIYPIYLRRYKYTFDDG